MTHFVLLFCLCAFGGDDRVTQQIDDTPTTADLIKQLGSPQFEQRQFATQQLWLRGRKAEQQLRIAAKESLDPEVKQRAGRMVEMFDLGIYHDTPKRFAQWVIGFHQGDHARRESIIAQLNQDQRWQLALQLIDTLEDQTAQWDLIRDSMASPSKIANLLINADDQQTMETVFSHPLMIRFYPDQCAWVALTCQYHTVQINQYESIIDPLTLKPWETSYLAQLYSGSGRTEDALRITRPFVTQTTDAEANILANYYFYLCLQNQRWEQASQEIDAYVDKNQNNAVVEAIWQPQIRRLFIHHQAGNQNRYDAALKAFNENERPMLQPDDSMRIYLSLMETDAALKVPGDQETFERFELLCLLDRYQDAFELVDLPDNPLGRKKWFEKQIDQLLAHGINENEGKRLPQLLNQQRLLPMVAFNLGLVGYEDEAMEYLKMLASISKGSAVDTLDYRQRILRYAVALDRPKELWSLLNEIFDVQEMDYLIDTLWDDNATAARHWMMMLEKEIPRPLERIRTVATIMNVSWRDNTHHVDVDEYVAKVEGQFIQSSEVVRAAFAEAISVAYEENNRQGAAQQWLLKASDLGSDSASMKLGKMFWQEQLFSEAQSRFEKIVATNPDACVARMLGWMAAQKVNPDSDKIKNMVRFAESGIVNSSDLQIAIVHLEELDEIDTAYRLGMKWLSCSKPISTQHAWIQYRLANLMGSHNLENGFVPWQMFLYSQLDRTSFVVSYANVGTFVRSGAIEKTKQLIRNGDIDQAMQLADRLHAFQPDIADLGDEVVTLLDQYKHTEKATQLLGKVVSHYQSQLKHFPQCSMYHNNLAWICARSNRNLDIALKHAEDALRLSKGNPTYMDTLAEVKWRLGKNDEAIELINKCIELSPSYEHYRHQLEKFKEQSGDEKSR
jgi:tetratricopeptide (TPR) repeat protein